MKLAQHAAARLALNDHQSLSSINTNDHDISQFNRKMKTVIYSKAHQS
jgi:hypothetical protein